MTPQPSQQAIAIHIWPNFLRSKGNRTIKVDPEIEYDMRNIFVKKSYTKCAGEKIPRPLSKKPKLSISLDRYCEILSKLLLLYANLRAIEM